MDVKEGVSVEDIEKLEKGWVDIDIARLVPADWNYKEDDALKAAKLVNNIKRNGQVQNVIIRELETGFYEVVNGNHRLRAFPEANIDVIHAFNLGTVSDAHARRVAVETNETNFETNTVKLASLMMEIAAEFPKDELVSTMPYNDEEMENFKKMVDFDWNQFDNQGGGSDGESDSSKKITISCTDDKYEEVKTIITSCLAPFDKFVKVK